MPAIPGYAHLAQDPTHHGGVPRVADPSVRVYSIWTFYEMGWSAEKISENYAPLSLAAVFSALAYAADHLEEMKVYREEDERAEAEWRKTYVMPAKLKEALERRSLLLRS